MHLCLIDADCGPLYNLFFTTQPEDRKLLDQFIAELPAGSKILGITSGLLDSRNMATLAASKLQGILNKPAFKNSKALAFVGVKGAQARFTRNTNNLGVLAAGWKPSWALGTTLQPELSLANINPLPSDEAGSGFWSPSDCTPRFKVAVIIPYKDRHEHQAFFNHNMANFLKAQQLAFSIFHIEPLGECWC